MMDLNLYSKGLKIDVNDVYLMNGKINDDDDDENFEMVMDLINLNDFHFYLALKQCLIHFLKVDL